MQPQTDPSKLQKSGRTLVIRWIMLWVAFYISSIVVYNASYPWTSNLLVNTLQVKPASLMVGWTLPDHQVRADRSVICTDRIQMDVARGCDGIEAWLLMATAFLAYPMSWRNRLGGIGWGSLLMFSLNYVRIVTMFHVIIRRPFWFDFVHDTLWQGGLVIACLLFVLQRLKPRSGRDVA